MVIFSPAPSSKVVYNPNTNRYEREKSYSEKITTIPAQKLGGINVTDFTTGESVKTTTSPSGTTTYYYSASPSGSSGQLGEEKAIQTTQQESLITPTQQSVSTSPTEEGKLKPSSSISTPPAFSMTTPPERYEQPLGSAFLQAGKNIFNFGIIGQQGLGAYTNQIFIEPFEYTKNRATEKISYEESLKFESYEIFDYMGGEQQKDISQLTNFEILRRREAKLYTEAGLEFKGEPTRILGTRLIENIELETKPIYEEKLKKGGEELFNIYQEKVNVGELSVPQATEQYKATTDILASSINQAYSQDVTKQYGARLPTDFSTKITSIESFSSKIFEPKVYSYGRTAKTIGEIGAVTAITAFGGSGLTLGASVYLGARTATESIKYVSDFNRLSTGQKIIGGVGLAVSALATGAVFKTGISKFYSEWRGLIYEGLATQPTSTAISTKEVLKIGKSTITKQAMERYYINEGYSITQSYIKATPSGATSIRLSGGGKTTTTIFNPETSKLLTTTESFKVVGNIPNIKELSFGTIKGAVISYEESGQGLGRGFYKASGQKAQEFQFYGAGQRINEKLDLIVAGKPTNQLTKNIIEVPYLNPQGRNYFIDIEYSGFAEKLKTTSEGANFIIKPSGAKSTTSLSSLYSSQIAKGAGASINIQSQKFSISNLAQQKVFSSSGLASVGIQTTALSQFQEEQQQVRQTFALASSQQFKERQEQKTIQIESFGSGSGVSESQLTIPSQIPSERQIPKLIPEVPTKSQFPPFTPNMNFIRPNAPTKTRPFIFDIPNLSFPDSDLRTKIITGGRRATQYTPSFSAILFNIQGTERKTKYKTGLNFRPITRYFKIRARSFI